MTKNKSSLLLTAMMLTMLFAMVPIGNMAAGGYTGQYPGHCVNDENFYYSDASHGRKTWHNYTLRNDANESYSYFNNDIWYAKASRHGGDDWADSCIGQGKAWHSGHPYSYLGKQHGDYSSLRYVMQYYPYVPVADHTGPDGHQYTTIGNEELNMSIKFKWYNLTWFAPNWPNIIFKVGAFPTVGLACMLYFNCYVYDNWEQEYYWLWNYSDPDYWNGPNMFLLEVFPMRKFITPLGFYWIDAQPGNPFFHAYIKETTHDADLHGVRLEGTAPNENQWYEFKNYDVGKELRDVSQYYIQNYYYDESPEWKDIDVLGFQLMAVALGNEVLCSSVKMEVDYFKLNSYDDQGAFDNYAFRTTANNLAGYYFRPDVAYTDQCLSGFIEQYTYLSRLNGDIVDNTLLSENAPDGIVDSNDLSFVQSRNGKTEGQSGYSFLADVYPDRKVDMKDVSMVSQNMNRTGSYDNMGYMNIKFNITDGQLTFYAWICCYSVDYSPNNLWDIPRRATCMYFYLVNYYDDPARGTYGQFIKEHNYANDLQ